MVYQKLIKISLCILLIFVFSMPNFTFALTPQEERQTLETELKKLEKEIAQYEYGISKTRQEKKTLQNQIYILRSSIEKLNLQIQESSIMIQDVTLQIQDTKYSITTTSFKIGDSKEQLSAILRIIYEEDEKTLLEILLSEDKLSDFFENLVYLENLSESSFQLLQNIKQLRSQLETQEVDLDTEKEDLARIRKIQILQKRDTDTTKEIKNELLERTKGEEALYQNYLQKSQRKAAEIRARIFELIGVPKAPNFGEALEIAKYVENITGVRPALLLAILTQESNIGRNVGQCYLKNPKTGEGVGIKSGKLLSRVMKPSRDITPFLKITQALGRDPYNTPVSCPMSFGWGGAMGPAQFIPSTWIIYKNELERITGKAGDPWNIRDAFLASALYLKDYGAATQNPNSEWKAAMIYFSGSTNIRYRFYGDSVLALAANYQKDINALK
ncbi:lytic murein transglycosylase [Patescibacteria group bacterium]|nr:lytic murein transglycosylase [Patescibacteria group bacterium]